MVRKALLIITPIVATIALIYVFGFKAYNESYDHFTKDGYVIDSSVQKKVFFSENASYKIVENSGYVELNDSDSKENKVEESSFVHYVDGSISTFKKAVFLDLDTLDNDSYQYYNIFPSSIISNVSGGYRINYLDTSINMKNILMKIDTNKYLLAAEHMEIVIKDDDTRKIDNSYLEIVYMDGNIIRLYNQEVTIQSVSNEFQIRINNDYVLNLVTKKIFYKNEEKLNLGEITINSDDNIEIIKSEENTEIIEEEEKKEINKNLPKITDGLITVKPNDGVEEIVDDTAKIHDAKFDVFDFETNANSVKANIQIEDLDGILSGPKLIKIIKTGTNEVVYYENDTTGKTSFLIDIETLKPDTNYTLIVNQDYVKNGLTFNRDFVQKSFVTSSLGLSLEKDFVRENSLGVIISKTSFSEVTRFDYALVDESGAEIKSGSVDFEYNDSVSLIFQGLTSNTKYSFRVFNFAYGNIMVADDTGESLTMTTLKIKPVVGKASFSVDKQNSKFSIYLSNVRDVDNGIVSFHADLYDTEHMILTKSALPSSKIDIFVDDDLITRHTDYRAYVYLIFNDNEKTYEIPIGSDVLNINSSNRGPIVTFSETEVTWESIKGNIYIQDSDDAIDNTQDVIITYQNLTISTDPVVLRKHNLEKSGDEDYILPVDVNNLKANDTYLFTVKATVDYNDENGSSLVDIGQFLVQTGMPKKMRAEFVDNESKTEAFSVKTRLRNAINSENTDLEASTMSMITIMLYKSGYDKTKPCVASNECWKKVLYDENNEAYESTLRDMLYFPNTDEYFTITPETLDIQTTDLSYAIYNLEILDAKDYTIYHNDLPITDNVFSITPSNIQEQIINNNAPLRIDNIKNNGAFVNLQYDTLIGYTLTPNLILSSEVTLKRIVFHVYDYYTKREIITEYKDPTSNTDVSKDVFFNDTTFVRGGRYYFKYYVSVEKDGEIMIYESPESQDVKPNREIPKFSYYLSRRDTDNSYWKYRIVDNDGAIEDDVFYYYFGTNDPVSIVVEKNSSELNEIVIPTFYGRLNVFHNILLNDADSATRYDDISFYFAPILSSLGDVYYTVSQNVNQAIFSFDLNDSIKNNVIAADVTLTSGDTSVSLSKVPVVSKKIYIDFGKIRELKGKGEITAKIKFYFDSNIYGLDLSGKVLMQDSTEAYIYTDGQIMYDFDSFNFNTTSKVISYFVNGVRKSLNYVPSNGYFVKDSNKVMFKKVDLSLESKTACIESCTFSFDAITPSFELSKPKITSSLFSVNIKPDITSFDDEQRDNIVVGVDIYNVVDEECGTDLLSHQNFSLNAMLNSVNIVDLIPGNKYCAMFKWSDLESSNVSFYYPSNNSYENSYILSTLQSARITNIKASYATLNGTYTLGRYMKITYNSDVTSGFSGIKYRIVNSSNNTEVTSVRINNTLIDTLETYDGKITLYADIYGKLLSGIKFNIEILPYQVINGEDYVFERYVTSFTLNIDQPKVVFTRTSDLENGSFSFKVTIRDTGNAIGNTISDSTKGFYDIYYTQSTGDGTPILIQEHVNRRYTKEYTINCPSGDCTVIVSYLIDTMNTGNFSLATYENEFNLEQKFELGEITTVSVADNNVIRLGFVGSYRLNAIQQIEYTIYDYEYNVVVNSRLNNFVFIEDGEAYSYLDLHENLSNGTYTIVLQFQSDTEGIISRTITYIKA